MGFDVRCGLIGKVELSEDEAVEFADGLDLDVLWSAVKVSSIQFL